MDQSSKAGIPLSKINVAGEFLIECWNRDGSLAWRRRFKNGVTNVGLDYLGGCMFANSNSTFPQFTSWYAGLIDSAGFSSLSQNDTMNSHAGWSESTIYSGNRPQWVNTEGGQQVSSNGPFTFPVTGTGNVHGMFLCSSSTRGGTSGTLWATALINSDVSISPGQSLTGTYSVLFSGG